MAAKRGGAKTVAKRAPAKVADNVVALNIPKGVVIGDGLANALTGMGMMEGRRGGDVYSYMPKSDAELMDMYRSDWMARKAVDIIAEDMTKAWRTWQLKPNQITAIDRAEVDLDLRRKVRDGVKWGRLLGGAALILSDGRRSELPLTVEGLSKGGLKYCVVVPRNMLDQDGRGLDWDPASDHFGEPEFYRMRRKTNGFRDRKGGGDDGHIKIHHTRVFRFLGNTYPDPMVENNPWSDSVLQVLYDAIRDAGIAMQASAALVEEAKVDIVTMEDLSAMLAADESNARLLERMRLLQLGKTTFNTLLMGGRETYDSKQVNFGSLDKVILTFLQVASGATDIPATRFLAQSPAGMNSTGESDLRNYSSLISSKQEDMEASIRRLDMLLLKHALGSVPKTWFYTWNPIWEMSPKEAAEVNKINAEADQIYIMGGTVPTMAIEKAQVARMIESGLYPGLEEAMLELSEEDLQQKRPDPPEIQLDPNNLIGQEGGGAPASGDE